MRRSRRRPAYGAWLWLLGALAGAAVVYLFFRRPGGPAIPVPGEAAPHTATAPSPHEDIRDSDREALERLLRERSRAH